MGRSSRSRVDRGLAAPAFLSLVAACSASARSEPQPARPTPLGRARAAAETSSAPSAQLAGETKPAPKLAVDEAWRWLRATLPAETQNLRIDASAENLEKLLAWAPGEAPTVVVDRSCNPLTLTRGERTLGGSVNAKTAFEGKTKTVHTDGISFGVDITVVCGSDVVFEHDASGAWVEASHGATGCAQGLGHLLSDVRDGQIWYAAERVTVVVGCSSRRTLQQRCTDGTTRACTACTGASLQVDPARGPRFVDGSTVGIGVSEAGPVDCSVPCPADELSPAIAAANAALAQVSFEQLGHEQHPTLFRDQKACLSYRQKHPIPSDQLRVW